MTKEKMIKTLEKQIAEIEPYIVQFLDKEKAAESLEILNRELETIKAL